MEKGSACVEVFREISHQFARTFGNTDRARRHKEVDIEQDLRLLCEDMQRAQLHIQTSNREILIPASVNKKGKVTKPARSAIVDCIDIGSEILNDGKFDEFIRTTTWDPAVGYPIERLTNVTEGDDVLLNGSGFDATDRNPLVVEDFNDVDDGDDHQSRCPGLGSLGGGIDL